MGTHVNETPSERAIRKEREAKEQADLVDHLIRENQRLTEEVDGLGKQLDAYGQANREFDSENERLQEKVDDLTVENRRLRMEHGRRKK